MKPRVVFDTTTIISALFFTNGRLAWLRSHWRDRACLPLISRATTEELIRVLGYKRFRLSLDDRRELLAEYLPSCELVEQTERCSTVCRDAKDQPFLDLAESDKADLLISGDQDLLTLVGQTTFLIESAEAYRRRFGDPKQIS